MDNLYHFCSVFERFSIENLMDFQKMLQLPTSPPPTKQTITGASQCLGYILSLDTMPLLQSWNPLYLLHWFCSYFILFVISCNISHVTISGCMDITSINSVSTAICFTYINLVVKKVGPNPPYQSNIHPPHTYLTMLPFSAVTNSLQMLATNQVHTQSQTLMAKFDP